MENSLPRLFAALLATVFMQQVQPAYAGASSWEETDGGRFRIVTGPLQTGATELRGALQIELEPGWKTYWREPGSAGIPPRVTVAQEAVKAVEIHFPAPVWVDDPYGSWAGYKHPVSLPLTFTLSTNISPQTIVADVFLGICRDICIPASGRFEVPLASSGAGALQRIVVDAAFSALPTANTEALSIENARWAEDGTVEVTLRHTGTETSPTALFVSAGTNHPFKKPVATKTGDQTTTFKVEPAFKPENMDALELDITARRGDLAVETILRLPAR
jgi:DsbC/DsbD-like thiol-disulfide interchange protein